MSTPTIKDEAELNRYLDAIKAQLVGNAEALVLRTHIARAGADFGKRQMSNLLEIAAAERSPEVLLAWMKGQIGKAKGADAWGQAFGTEALKEVKTVDAIVTRAFADRAWSGTLSAAAAKAELLHRCLILFFGYARWQMLYVAKEGEGDRRDDRRPQQGPRR